MITKYISKGIALTTLATTTYVFFSTTALGCCCSDDDDQETQRLIVDTGAHSTLPPPPLNMQDGTGYQATLSPEGEDQLDRLQHGHKKEKQGGKDTDGTGQQDISSGSPKTPPLLRQEGEDLQPSPMKRFRIEDIRVPYNLYQREIQDSLSKIQVSERIFNEFLNTDDESDKRSRSLMKVIREIHAEHKAESVFYDIKISKSNWCMLEYTINAIKAEKRVVYK